MNYIWHVIIFVVMFVCFPVWRFGVFICQLLVVSESMEISNIILNLELNQGFLIL